MGKTSTAATQRYKSKTYTRMVLDVRKDTAAAYKARCQELGIPYSQPLHEAIRRVLDEAEQAQEATQRPASHEKGEE